MRNAIKKNKKSLALSAVAAAGLSAWVGAPAAHGALVVTPVDIGTFTIGTQSYTDYVFTAAFSGADGNELESGDVTVDVAQSLSGAIGVDVEHSNSSTGAAAKYYANVDGSQAPSEIGVPANEGTTASENEGQSVFGDPGAGTFSGVGYNINNGDGVASPFSTDLTDNPFVTNGSGLVFFNYTQNQTSTFGLGGNGGVPAVYNGAKLTGTGHLDSAYQPVVPGEVAGTGVVYSLETNFTDTNASAAVPQPATAANPDPFQNVVIKTGTTFTLTGQLVANLGTENFQTVIGVVNNVPSITLSLTNNTPSSTLGATVHVSGSNGHYSFVNAAIASGAQIAGYADVTGFNPATDAEVYGFQVDVSGSPATGTQLAALVADINADLSANQTAYTLPSGPASGLGADAVTYLEGLGDNVELTATGVTDDIFPNWAGLNGATVTQITVVPEPTALAGIILGGSALLARKRRRKA